MIALVLGLLKRWMNKNSSNFYSVNEQNIIRYNRHVDNAFYPFQNGQKGISYDGVTGNLVIMDNGVKKNVHAHRDNYWLWDQFNFYADIIG